MSKKRKRALGGDVVWRQTAEEATLAAKPRYNGYACGHGPHGSKKYDRAKAKRAWRSRLGQEGASRGLLPLFEASCKDWAGWIVLIGGERDGQRNRRGGSS